MPKVGLYLPLGRINLIATILKFYNLIPRFIRNYLVRTKLNFFLFVIYSLLISKFQKYYSQSGEDMFIQKYLPEHKGTYIDIGSGQPIRGSNTYFFYKLGWCGYLIDPLLFNFKLNRIFRTRDVKILGAIAKYESTATFFELYPYEYSTLVHERATYFSNKARVWIKDIYDVNTFPLSALTLEMSPIDPTFISVDVEGFDLEVLKSNDWVRILPRVVCVEAPNPVITPTEISVYLSKLGYEFVGLVGISNIFVHKSYLVSRISDEKHNVSSKSDK
jgi:hypothetical protein